MSTRIRAWLLRFAVVSVSAVVVATTFSVPASADPRCANNDPWYGFCVGGKILEEFNQAGGFNFFGNATTPESNTQNGGKYQKFTKNSTIYWHQNVSGGHANSVGGLIRDKWVAKGYELGIYGYPTTRELPARKPGRYNRFQGGGVYWAQGAPQAYAVVGGGQIEQTWAANDWENGSYGFPTSDEYDFEGGKKQDFQNGSIVWKPGGFTTDWLGDEDGTDYASDCAPANTNCGEDARGITIGAKTLPTMTPEPPRSESRIASSAQTCDVTQPSAPKPTPSTTAPAPATTTSAAPTSTPVQQPSAPSSTPGSTPAVESTTTTAPSAPGTTTSTTTTSPASPAPPSISEETPGTTSPTEVTPTVGGSWCRGQARTESAPPSNQRAITTNCENHQEEWKGTRKLACYLDRTAALIRKSTEGEEIGRIEGVESMDVLANWNSTQFTTEYNFEITNVEGEAHPTFISATHECLIRSGGGACTGTGSTNQSVPAVVGAEVRIVSTFNVPVGTANSGVIRYAQAITRLVVTTPSQEEMAPFAQEVQAARVRCDSAPAMHNSTGCVIGDVEPIWDLRGYNNLDQYRRHVSLAQQSGLPGYPNDSGDGLPLNRIINQADKDARRAITCGGVTGPRTGERDCDEYPMASTQQGGGGGTGNGVARTFDPFCGIRDTGITPLADINPSYRGLGWSVCLISNTQNRRAGSLQGWFYTKSRVINGDGFLVRAN